MQPETYTPASLQNIRQHISDHIGEAEYYMQMSLDNGLLVEIDIVRPTYYRNFYTLVTVGLGAYLNPEVAVNGGTGRCELTFYLPANWQTDCEEWNKENRNWPIDLLKTFVGKAVSDGISVGTVVDNGGAFDNCTAQCAATLIEQVEDEMRVCTLEGDVKVEFLSVFSIYREECEFLRANGVDALMQTIDDDLEIIQVAPLCLSRKNVLGLNNKNYWLKHESQILSDWTDGPYCYASDSIMVDGKPIGYCFRVEPDESDTLGWDSGWRFFAVDDDQEYRDNPKNIGNFELNTLCNVDSLILPLLHAPFGSAFRRVAGGDFVFEAGPVIPQQKTLMPADVRKHLEEMTKGNSVDFEEVIKYLRLFMHDGIDRGLFTLDDVRVDLEMSLWYGYACINAESYEHSFEAAALMPSAENYTFGCGCWYYRYSAALMNCGRLKRALRYAEYGVIQEPEYPWNWLQLGKLRAHFGDKEGALQAVDKGLAIVPGDYEFLTLQREINAGATLEQMAFHVIDPDSDQRLQDGTSPNYEHKKRLVAGLVCDANALKQVKAMFKPMSEWSADTPYCSFTWNITAEPLVIGFGMNEAALSKIDLAWLWTVREKLDGPRYRRRTDNKGVELKLVTVMIGWNKQVDLIYQYPNSTKLMKMAMKV